MAPILQQVNQPYAANGDVGYDNIGNHGAADNQNLAEMQYSYPSHYTTDVTQLDQGHFSTSEGATQSPVLKGRMSNISEEAGYNNY